MPAHIKHPELHDVEWLRQRVAAGKNTWQIATELGCSFRHVTAALARFKLKPARGLTPASREPFRAKCAARMTGSKNPNWQGGRFEARNGYVQVYVPEHPFATGRQQYVLEHRLVMEKKLGRYLLPSEVVHHINRKRNDNRIENLLLLSSNSEHRRLHAEEDKKRSR